jgi:formylglycine-generating enzyme required for sulfatase activity
VQDQFRSPAVLRTSPTRYGVAYMAYDAFISYSNTDKTVADAACATLEKAEIRCWIAPRDVPPGSQWASAIVGGIDRCRIMVLIFSSRANISSQILREVERATSKGIPIIPLRIEDVTPTNSMGYFLGSIHWLDALTPPLEKHLQRLAETVKSCLAPNAVGPDTQTYPDRAQAAVRPAIQPMAHWAQPHPRRGSQWMAFAAVFVAAVVCVGVAVAYLGHGQTTKVAPAPEKVTPAPEIAAPPNKQQTAAVPVEQPAAAPPPAQPVSGPCGGTATAGSLVARCAMPLSGSEERALKPKDSFRECDKRPEVVVVPAGSFGMGSPPNEAGRYDSEGPLHQVTLSRQFGIGKVAVTADEFAAFVAETGHEPLFGCYTLGGGKVVMGSGLSWRSPGFAQSGSQPAVCVSWSDAKLYVVWLSGKTGKAYRLPTEAEWEYTARAGTTTRYFFGDSEKDFCRYGNGFDLVAKGNLNGTESWPVAPCNDGYVFTAPVGSFLPNGLYDMLGNAMQWTEDCLHDSYRGAPSDGSAWTSGDCNRRIFRGSGWASGPRDLRSAWRFGIPLSDRGDAVGFRVVRALTP